MREIRQLTAIAVAGAMILAVSGIARADDNRHRRGMSTTERVIAGVAVAAAVGLTAYALTRGHGHQGHHYPPRRYVAVETGFRPYSVGNPYGPHNRHRPRGYLYRGRGQSFWRTPYVYNPHHDRAYNAGWERGYWAGYLQGRSDSRLGGGRYMDSFSWSERHLWGYSRGYGPHDSYQRAFHTAFRIGYRHGFYGIPYGTERFGFSMRIGYTR